MPTTHSHTQTMPDGSQVDVFKLHKILKDRAITTVSIKEIQKPNRSKRTGFSKIRSEKANVSFPLIVTEDYFLIDGRHRYFKLEDNGVAKIKIVIATKSDIRRATL